MDVIFPEGIWVMRNIQVGNTASRLWTLHNIQYIQYIQYIHINIVIIYIIRYYLYHYQQLMVRIVR